MSERQDKTAQSKRAQALADEVRRFLDEFVMTQEPSLAQNETLQAKIAEKARAAGLWGVFYPLAYGGQIASLEDYLLVAEQEGRTEFSQAIFGSNSALDAHILLKYGNATVHKHFLEPLAAGQAVPGYGMTEPLTGDSTPSLIRTTARLSGGEWTINGRKWFISNSDQASFVTVLVRTGEQDASAGKALSMLVVPTDAPGLKIERRYSMLGHYLGQGEVSFDAVKIPEQYILGAVGEGVELMRKRLSIGRLLHSMHWLGLAQRCFDLLGAHINSEFGIAKCLADKQLVRRHVVSAYQAIVSARELIRTAANRIDAHYLDDVAVNIAKMAASQAICTVSDAALQLYGDESLSNRSALSRIYRIARTSRILDGSEEALTSSVGRRLIEAYKQGEAYRFA